MLNNLGLKKISLLLTGTALACFGLAAMLFFNIDLKGFKDNKYLYNINEEKSFAVETIKNININTFSSDINIIDTDDSKVKVHIYGKLYSKNRQEVNNPVIELNNEKLDIKQSKKEDVHIGINFNIGNLFNANETKIDLFIPKSYRENIKIDSFSGDIVADPLNIKELNVNTFSAEIVLNEVTADTVSLETSSGDIKAKYIKANNNIKINSFSGNNNFGGLKTLDFNIENSSGEMSLGVVETEKTTISTFSGDIGAKEIEAVDADISTSAGNIRVNDVSAKKILCKTFDGDITFNKAKLKDSDIETSSGNVAIRLNENSEFDLDAGSSSGDVSCEFPITSIEKQGEHEIKGIVGKADGQIKIETFSGDISISK